MITTRAAKEADIPAIAEIHAASRRRAYRDILPPDRQTVADRVKSWTSRIQSTTVVVGELKGSIAGWVAYGPSRDPDGDGATEVFALYVAPASWRVGVGAALWREVESSVAENGGGDVTLWVLEANVNARKFYEDLGFAEDGGLKSLEADGGLFEELRYRCRVDPSLPAKRTSYN